MKKRTCAPATIILGLQAALFYLLPLAAGPTDAMGLVLLLLLGTLGLSGCIGWAVNRWFVLLYPIAVAVIFVPTVWLYYNETALIHMLWYLVASLIGVSFGAMMRMIGRKRK